MLPPFLLPGDLEEECLELPPFFFTIFEDDGGRLESEFSSSEDVSDLDGVFPLCPVGRRSTLTGEEAWTSTSAAGGLGSKIIDGGPLLIEPSSEVVYDVWPTGQPQLQTGPRTPFPSLSRLGSVDHSCGKAGGLNT